MANPIRKYSYYLGSIFKLLAGVQNWPLAAGIFLGLAPQGERRIQLRNGAQMKVRGPMDVWSVKETFLDRFYERFGAAVEDGWRVVDIGGGIGEYTLFAALGRPGCKVYAFEPFPPSFEILQENVRLNRADNVQAFQEAIGDQSGFLDLDLTPGEPLKLQSRAEGEGGSGKIRVPCRSLQEAFARLGIEQCDMLKLDCEGAEYNILFGAPDETLKRIRRIVMEYHDSLTSHTHRDLVKFLSEKGFHVQVTPNYVHDDLGYLYASR